MDQLAREIEKDCEEKVARLNVLSRDEEVEYKLIGIGGPGAALPEFKCQVVYRGRIQGLIGMDQVDKRIKRLSGRSTFREFIEKPAGVTGSTTSREDAVPQGELNKVLFDSIDLINKFKSQLTVLNR